MILVHIKSPARTWELMFDQVPLGLNSLSVNRFVLIVHKLLAMVDSKMLIAELF